jgi:site-specific DNA-methyltransferase (adenine-specific)
MAIDMQTYDRSDLLPARSLLRMEVQKSSHPVAEFVYYESDSITLYQGDAGKILPLMRENSVDCIVTSPPYYGQRDYGEDDQIGLESSPQQYIDRLVAVFGHIKRILKSTGSLWVNIGDTYWSGKGRPKGKDSKQKHRRFDRPQDKVGEKPWCVSKQLLLIPHRFAIAMQEDGWIVRNDNVWSKVAPTPDPVDDRCSLTHEYMFHFVKKKKYYFDAEAVAVPSAGNKATKPPASVWSIRTANNRTKHQAVFPDELVSIPIKSTCPPNGIVLDPFCGTGTSLSFAVLLGGKRKGIGIDISINSLNEAVNQFRKMPQKRKR